MSGHADVKLLQDEDTGVAPANRKLIQTSNYIIQAQNEQISNRVILASGLFGYF